MTLPNEGLEPIWLQSLLPPLPLSVRWRTLRVPSAEETVSNLAHLALDAAIRRERARRCVESIGLVIGFLEGWEGEERLEGRSEVAAGGNRKMDE